MSTALTFSDLLRMASEALEGSDRFEAELRLYLLSKGGHPLTVAEVLRHLLERGYLNDVRVANLLVARRSGRRAVGAAKLRAELESRLASPESMEAALAPLAERQVEEARAVLLAHFPDGCTHQKAWRFLARRGFEDSVIEEVLLAYVPTDDTQ